MFLISNIKLIYEEKSMSSSSHFLESKLSIQRFLRHDNLFSSSSVYSPMKKQSGTKYKTNSGF